MCCTVSRLSKHFHSKKQQEIKGTKKLPDFLNAAKEDWADPNKIIDHFHLLKFF